MPREQINYPVVNSFMVTADGNELAYEPGTEPPPGAVVYTDNAIHVNWTPAAWAGNDFHLDDPGPAHVQVSIQLPAGYLRHLAERLDESVSSTHVYTPPLTRQELNKLIRVLRTARDKAHGRDE